jgi:hypothetical protein
MQPYLEAQAATGESGVPAVGVAQEYLVPELAEMKYLLAI